MTEERTNLQPDMDDAAPDMHYDDLKYPLLQRGIPVPVAMQDYIQKLIARDTLSDDDIEAIRQEMLQVFQTAEQKVPEDFHKHFDTWFSRGS